MDTKTKGTREWSERSFNFSNHCSWMCGYCVGPDALIYMRNGTFESISSLKIGSKIWGVDNNTPSKRYSFKEATVLKIWTTTKLAYKIIMENGIEIICSGDHRWLTDRGWKYTIKSGRNPYLTRRINIKSIASTIELIKAQEFSDLYKKGYLSGQIRGDGLLRTYDYSGKKRTYDIQYQFRFTIKDSEGVDRVSKFLQNFSIDFRDFIFKNYTNNEEWKGIRTSKREEYNKIKDLIEYQLEPEYYRGFLAGIFDSEGSYSGSSIRISNTNPEINKFIKKSLDYFNIKHSEALRLRGNNKPLTEFVITHSNNITKFFQITVTAINRKKNFEGKQLNNVIKIKDIIPLGYKTKMYDITTSTGNFIANGFVSHNCYAKGMALRFHQIETPEEWGIMTNKIKPSLNPNRKYEGIIMTPTSHDITLSNVDLAKKYYKQLLLAGNTLLIVSKPIKRAIFPLSDHLEEFKDTNQITWRFSITTMLEERRKIFEPKAPGIQHRLEVLEEMYDRGWNTSVSIEPFLDITLPTIVASVIPCVREKIWIGIMNKQFCPKKLWVDNKLAKLYSPIILANFKTLIDTRFSNTGKIKYKDNFVNNLPKNKQTILTAYGSGGILPPQLEGQEKRNWKSGFK